MKLFYPLLALSFFIPGCSEKLEKATSPVPSATAIELPVTAEVGLPEKGVAYAFVPNDVAQWLSQIIILSADGDLYQSTADTLMAKSIEGPKSKSIIGLNRPKAPGMFLSIDQASARIHAYLEINDDGDFEHIGEIASDLTLIEFCSSTMTPKNQITAIAANNKPKSFEVSVNNREIELIPVETASTCEKAITLQNDSETLRLSNASDSSIVLTKPGANPVRVDITNGITIPGVETPQSLHAVPENFGGPFNNGLVLVSDADEPRFVVISADFARKTLSD